ncbi:flagellar hook-length control protein FliK [Paraconexibacter algicola]|uniref:Flagellar hook-length control protein-like C-terminal domain-containing protein n=1 Tax=Paraconexibacter algicola TaxID=2133960 RepID=A0A2T4UIW5_9ACTN|nr:flagellar hook-length control protein FliK [Paraconexibacter algicola]PTL59169.1 hypothetical protein C7Y72_05660 [Paraconexibacter algicola]
MRTSPVAEPPGAPPGGRARNEARPADPSGFPALLTETTARTAPAEGHRTETPRERRDLRRDHDGRLRRDDARRDERPAALAASAPDAPAAGGPASPELQDPEATAAPTAVPAPPAGATPAVPVLPTVPGATAPESVPTTETGDPGAVGGTAPTVLPGLGGAGTEGVPTAATGAPVAAGADADDLPGDAAPTGTAAPAPTPAPGLPGGPPLAAGAPAADGQTTAAGDATAAPTTAGERADGAPAAPAAAAPTPAAPAPAPTSAATAAPAPTAPAPAPAPGELPQAWAQRGLAQTVDRMIDLVHVATARGVARARLQLHPQELGGIEVRLRQSVDGLVAQITAQNGDAVQAVAQAGAELRRSLEERGLQLASLDIRLAADGDAGSPWQQHAQARGREDAPGRAATTAAIADALADTDPDLVTDPAPSAAAPAGALVDVVA